MPVAKIQVEWMEGRSKGTHSWIKRSDVKEGRIATGERVKVIWGKSKKVHAAIVKDDGLMSPTIPTQQWADPQPEIGISFNLGSPASIPDQVEEVQITQPPIQQNSEIVSKMEEIFDALSAQNAKVILILDSFEKNISGRLDELERRVASLQLPIQPPPLDSTAIPEPDPVLSCSSFCVSPLPLQEINQTANHQMTRYIIPQEIVYTCLNIHNSSMQCMYTTNIYHALCWLGNQRK